MRALCAHAYPGKRIIYEVDYCLPVFAKACFCQANQKNIKACHLLGSTAEHVGAPGPNIQSMLHKPSLLPAECRHAINANRQ